MSDDDSTADGIAFEEMPTGVDRRTVMKSAVATASALSLAGCTGADDGTPTGGGTEVMTEAVTESMTTPTATEVTTGATDGQDAVHPPVWLHRDRPRTGTPVEPDHTVPRRGRRRIGKRACRRSR